MCPACRRGHIVPAAGLGAIAAEPKDEGGEAAPTEAAEREPQVIEAEKPESFQDAETGGVRSLPVAPRAGTKISDVIGTLERGAGATIDEIVAATGWLPHTARAALTGLRKRGYAIASDRSRGTVYRIARAKADGDATDDTVAMAEAGGDNDHVTDANPPVPTVRKAAARKPAGGGLRWSHAGSRGLGASFFFGGRIRSGAPDRQESRGADSSADLRRLISSLPGLDKRQLLLQWRNHLGGAPPGHLPSWLLARVLAYRLQAAALGDLEPGLLRKLKGAEDAGTRIESAPFANRPPATRDGVDLRPGAILAREWRGKLERVTILEDGYAWSGKTLWKPVRDRQGDHRHKLERPSLLRLAIRRKSPARMTARADEFGKPVAFRPSGAAP